MDSNVEIVIDCIVKDLEGRKLREVKPIGSNWALIFESENGERRLNVLTSVRAKE